MRFNGQRSHSAQALEPTPRHGQIGCQPQGLAKRRGRFGGTVQRTQRQRSLDVERRNARRQPQCVLGERQRARGMAQIELGRGERDTGLDLAWIASHCHVIVVDEFVAHRVRHRDDREQRRQEWP